MIAALLVGCGADGGTPATPDTGVDAGAVDTGAIDTGIRPDTGVRPDTGSVDTGSTDTGSVDAGDLDTGALDTGALDTGALDTGAIDAGAIDAGAIDAGAIDAGSTDAGSIDAVADTGPTDTGTTDRGPADTGADAGPRDATADAVDAPPLVDVQSSGCALPLATITLPGTVAPLAGVTRGTSTIPSARCQSGATGPENVYNLTVTAATGVILDTDNAATTFDTVVSIRRTCGDLATDVACDDDNGTTRDASSVLRTALAPGNYSVIVDGYNGAAGSYVLRARTYDAAANAVCASATTLTAAAPLTAQNIARGGGRSTTCVASSTGGGQLFYTFVLPANSMATLRATPTGATPTWTPVLRALDGCAATTCAANASGGAGTAASLVVANGTGTPRTYTLAVSATAASATGTFDLAATVTTVVPTSSCDAPGALVVGGTAITGNTTLGSARATRCSPGDASNEVYYTVTVAPGQRVSVRAQPQSGGTWRARVRSATACADTSCLNSAVATADGGEALLAIDNRSQLPRTQVISVTSTTAPGGPFTLAATTAAITPAIAPYYTLTSITGACDDVAGGTAVTPSGGWNDDNTTVIAALPFPVPFFATRATHYSVSSNGFAQLWTSSTGSPESSYENLAIPTADNTNNFVAPFWDDLIAVDGVSGVRLATLGAAPSRRALLEWTNWRRVSGSSSDRLRFQAKLFETTGVIEFHYCTITPVNAGNTGSSATVGVENAAGTLGNQIAYEYPGVGVLSTATAFRLTPPSAL